jgi:hypothetical protein
MIFHLGHFKAEDFLTAVHKRSRSKNSYQELMIFSLQSGRKCLEDRGSRSSDVQGIEDSVHCAAILLKNGDCSHSAQSFENST